jgi:hypothetical protein
MLSASADTVRTIICKFKTWSVHPTLCAAADAPAQSACSAHSALLACGRQDKQPTHAQAHTPLQLHPLLSVAAALRCCRHTHVLLQVLLAACRALWPVLLCTHLRLRKGLECQLCSALNSLGYMIPRGRTCLPAQQ